MVKNVSDWGNLVAVTICGDRTLFKIGYRLLLVRLLLRYEV